MLRPQTSYMYTPAKVKHKLFKYSFWQAIFRIVQAMRLILRDKGNPIHRLDLRGITKTIQNNSLPNQVFGKGLLHVVEPVKRGRECRQGTNVVIFI